MDLKRERVVIDLYLLVITNVLCPRGVLEFPSYRTHHP
jgi:hypothetical protein